MAQRTISAAGGNWNATATWVEGAVPTTSDHIIGDATSGNLVVNVTTANTQYADFTGWTGTLTINSNVIFNTAQLSGSTTTLNAGSYSFLGSGITRGRISIGSLTKNVGQVVGSPIIPSLRMQGTTTLTSNLYIEDFQNTGKMLSNQVVVSGNFYTTETSVDTTTTIELVGNGVIEGAVGNSIQTGHQITFNTPGGTYSIRNNGLILNSSSSMALTAGGFRWIDGDIINGILICRPPGPTLGVNGRILLDIAGAKIDTISLNYNRLNAIGSSPPYPLVTLELSSPLECNYLYITQNDLDNNVNSGGEGNVFRVSGDALGVGTLVFETSVYTRGNNDGNLVDFDRSWILELDPGYTHSVGSINMGGNGTINTQVPRLRSATAGTPATIDLGDESVSYAAFSEFTDITIINQTLHTYFSTLSNTSGITNHNTFVPGGGGGETSHVFAS